MANRDNSSSRSTGTAGNRLRISVEYVGIIAIVCLFAGALIGWNIAPKQSAARPSDAVSMGQLGDDSAVQAALRRIQQETDPAVLVEIGNHGYDQQRPDIAIPAYEKALTIKPDDPNVLSDLAKMYLDIHQTDKAIELNKKAIALDPNHYKSRYNLGVCYMNAGNNADAKKTFEDLIKAAPNTPEAKDAAGKLIALSH